MKRKTLKVAFILFVLAMVFLFLYHGLGFSNDDGWLATTFILNDKAKIAGGLVLLSYPIYKILKRRTQP